VLYWRYICEKQENINVNLFGQVVFQEANNQVLPEMIIARTVVNRKGS
jgi:hypothetical protein